MFLNKGRVHLYLRAICVFTLVCFSTTTAAWGMPVLNTEYGVRRTEIIHAPSLAETIAIPAGIGRIQAAYIAPALTDPVSHVSSAAPVIVHIQEAHGQAEGQENIERILTHLKKQYNFKTIFLEGAWGELDPENLHFLNDVKLNRELLEALDRVGLIGGVELFLAQDEGNAVKDEGGLKDQTSPAVRHASSGAGYGVEDLELYRRNLEQFRKVYAGRSVTGAYLEELRMKIVDESAKTFSPDLKAFFRQWAFRTEVADHPFAGFEQLCKVAEKHLALDLSDAREQYDWPQLVRFVKLQALEKSQDKEPGVKYEAEKQRFLKWLDQSGLDREFKTYFSEWFGKDPRALQASRPSEGIRSVMERFYAAALPKGFRFEDYPAFTRRIGAAVLSSELQSPDLFTETEKLNDLILTKLAGTEAERVLIDRYRQYRLLKKLFSLALTRDEHEKLVKNKADPVRDDPNTPGAVKKLYDLAMDFYATAQKRERVMFEKMLERMKSLKEPNAVLVTGGFHSGGLSGFFKTNHISCINISPRITKLQPEDEYLSLMTQGTSGVEKAGSGALPEELRSNLRQPTLIMGPELQKLGDLSGPVLQKFREVFQRVSSRNPVLAQKDDPAGLLRGPFLKAGQPGGISAMPGALVRSEVRNYPPDVMVYPPERTRAELLVYEAPSEKFQFDQVSHSAEWGDTQYRSVKDMPYPTKTPWEMLEAPVRAFWEKEGGTVAVISSGNLFHNDFFVAYRGDRQILYRAKNEPFQDRTYTMFTVWNRPKAGGRIVSAEKLRFKTSKIDPKRVEVYLASDTAMKNELSPEIKFAVFGQQLIDHTRGESPEQWAVPLEEFAYQFGDPFQLFDYPQLKKIEGDGTIYGEGVGKNEAYEGPKHPLKAMDRATLTGIVRDDGYMETGLENYQTRSYRETYTLERIEKEALIDRGYVAVTPRDKKDLKEGEYFIDAENRLHIRLRHTRYPHDLAGVTRSGKMVSIVLAGNKHRGAGYTIEEARDAVRNLKHPGLEGDPITDVFLLANSIDAFKRVNGRFVALFQETEDGRKKFEPYPSGSAAIAFLTPRQHPALEAGEKRSEVRGGPTADLSPLGRLRDHFRTPQRISWLHENKDDKGRPLGVETVEALVQYDEFSDVFDVMPSPLMRQRYGTELQMLDMPAAQEQIGIPGSFGMITVVQQNVDGAESIIFDEIHPSRGFRKLKPARMLRLLKPWAEASIAEMVNVLNSAGVRRFYASHSERIKARYARFRMPIPEANLAMNYVLPFQDKEWEPVEADVPPDGKTLVWRLKEAGIAAIEAKSKARALRLDALREKSYERMRSRFAKAGFFLTDVRYIYPQYIIGLGEMYQWASGHTREVNFRVASIHVPKEYFAEEKADHVFTSPEAIAMIISEICKNTDHIDIDDQAFIGAKLNLEKDLLEITYYDDGIGNPEAVRHFGEVYTTSGLPHRGYGLRLIKYLTEALGGHVDFHSNPRYGHYLRLLIPIVRSEVQTSGEAPALNSKPGPGEGKRAEVRDATLPAAATKTAWVHTGDQHDEAFTWFKKKIDLGHIPKGLPLVLFDSHSDVYNDRALNHTNWVYHLLKEGYISRVLWVVPTWAKDLSGDDRAIYEQVADDAREILAKHGIPASSFSWCFLDEMPQVNAQALVSMDYDFFSRDEDMIYRASEEEIRDLAGVVFKQLDDQQVRAAAFDLTRSGEPYTYPDQVPLIEEILNASVRSRSEVRDPDSLTPGDKKASRERSGDLPPAAESWAKAVVFDIGNVIVRTHFLKVGKAFVRAGATGFSAANLELLLPTLFQNSEFERGQMSARHFFGFLKRYLKLQLSFEDFLRIWANIFEPIPETVKLIKQIRKAGYKVFFLSDANPVHIGHFKKTFPEVFFLADRVYTSYELKARKAEGTVIFERMGKNIEKRFGIPLSEMVFLDDRQFNVDHSNKAGLQAVLFSHAAQAKGDLRKILSRRSEVRAIQDEKNPVEWTEEIQNAVLAYFDLTDLPTRQLIAILVQATALNQPVRLVQMRLHPSEYQKPREVVHREMVNFLRNFWAMRQMIAEADPENRAELEAEYGPVADGLEKAVNDARSESRDPLEYFMAQAKELKIVLGSVRKAEALAMIDAYLKTYSYQSRAVVSSLKSLLAYGLPSPIATFFANRGIFDKTEQSNILSVLKVLYSVKAETPALATQDHVPMPKIPAKAIVAKDKRLGTVVDPHSMEMTPEAQALVVGKMIDLAKESFSGFRQTSSTEGQYTARLSNGHVLLLVSPERELTGVVWAVTREASSFSELKNLFTKQDNVRGRGTLLLELYLRDLQKKGVQSVVWESRTDKARDFYLNFLDARKGGDLVENYTQLNGSFSITLHAGGRPRAEVRDGMQALEQRSTGGLSHELFSVEFLSQSHTEKRPELRSSGEPAEALSSVPSELIALEAQTAGPGQRVLSSQRKVLPDSKSSMASSLEGEKRPRSLQSAFTGEEKDFAQKVTARILRPDKVGPFTRDAWESFWEQWVPAAYAKQAEIDYAPLFEKVTAEAGTPVSVIFDRVPDLAAPVLQAMVQFAARNRFIPFLFVLHGADASATLKFKKDFEAAVLRKAGKAITIRVADNAMNIPELIAGSTPEKALIYDMRADGGQALTRLEPGLRQHRVFERTMRVYDPAVGDQKPADFFATLKEFFGQKEIKTQVQSALDIFSNDLQMQAAAQQVLERAA